MEKSKDKPPQKTIWIIHYADGHLQSHFGTAEDAKNMAEERCVLHGGDYIIA